ncbi:HipA domain-containing protein [Scandinavium manionii]|uniref:HipA domain-containing protein n=1 Tax=Scandinavium manionii TaxID=2926520 RepID=UPI00216545F7|nr:HipA domain-containing protein [Scandinavium manionii]MCS2146885.1 HipA domain-containing protein [Scandinavium manionii]
MQTNNPLEDDQSSPTEIQPLFGLEIVEWTPPNGTTGHLRSFAKADDGLEYAIKRIEDGQVSNLNIHSPELIPAAEWFCSKLAEACGLPSPTCRILLDPENNQSVFGSRIDLAAYRGSLGIPQWRKLLNDSDFHMRKQLWSIYAFDQFIYNVDRHINNYLYVQNRQQTVAIQAFDFSMSSLVMGWPNRTGTLLVPAESKTGLVWPIIKTVIGNDSAYQKSATNLLSKLSSMDISVINGILNAMPEPWMPALRRDALLAWWDSNEKQDRLDIVETEVKS